MGNETRGRNRPYIRAEGKSDVAVRSIFRPICERNNSVLRDFTDGPAFGEFAIMLSVFIV